MARPYVLLSVAVSLDGYLDDASEQRLILSNPLDLDRVDGLRAGVDAILVGAQTVRRDNPRLLVNSAERRARRVATGLPEYPVKITMTRTGQVDRQLRFWHTGGQKIIYTVDGEPFARVRAELGDVADVVAAGTVDVDLGRLLDDLGARGIRRLMVEGGGHVHTAFLAQRLADELQLALAPIFVGDRAAPRFLHDAAFPGTRLHLEELTRVGDVAVLRYLVQGPPPTS